MQSPLTLRVYADGDGLQVSLGYAGYRARSASLAEDWLARFGQALRALRSNGPTLLLPGRDFDVTQRELAVGHLLGETLTASIDVARLFGQAVGEAEGPLTLMVEATVPGLEIIPWELIGGDPGGQALETEGVVVARLAGSRPPRASAARSVVRTWVWEAGPRDAVTDRVRAQLAATTEALDWSAPACARDADLEADAAHVLFLLAHGTQEAGRLVLGTTQATGTAIHGLASLLPQMSLVVLAVCHGGGADGAPIGGLPERLIALGAPAVIASAGRINVEAFGPFVDALYRAFAAGDALVSAVAAGRTAVRSLALPHPDARWHQLALHVAGAGVVTAGPLLAPRWRPTGWPAPASDAAEVLNDAHRLAQRSGVGYFGVEHIFLALAARPPAETRDFFRFQLSGLVPTVEAFLGRFRERPERAPSWSGTPRIHRIGAALPSHFDSAGLWAALLDLAEPTLGRILNRVELPAVSTDEVGVETQPVGRALQRPFGEALGLEILGGPEDGRRLRLAPQQTLGRWAEAGAAEVTLYAGCAVDDPALPRQALRWVGPGLVEILDRTGGRLHTVAVGEVIGVGRATAFLGIGEDSAGSGDGL